MKKTVKDFKERALPNLNKIRGGGSGGGIDRDKVLRPKPGKG